MARRFGRVAVALVAAALVLGAALTWLHHGSAGAKPQPASIADLLQPYRLPAAAMPAGFSQSSLTTLTNTSLAGALQDPQAIRQLVASGHLAQLRQVLSLRAGVRSITVFLDLYLDDAGARGALADQTVAPGVSVVERAPIELGDVGTASHIRYSTPEGQTQDEETVGFARGRVTARVSEAGSADGISESDVLPLLNTIADLLSRRPPPPPGAAERRLVQDETSPRAILHDAYQFLLTNYSAPLEPAAVLRAALAGAAAAAGVAEPQGAVAALRATEPDTAWVQFLQGYQQIERSVAASRSRELAYAAINAMYTSLDNCHTVFLPPDRYARQLQLRQGEAAARIGVQLTVQAPILVLRVEAGSPAATAGVQPGDRILAVDGLTPERDGEAAVGQALAGDAGSTVVLTLQRPGVAQPFDLPIVREPLPADIERHTRLGNNIGYIALDSFVLGDASVDSVRTAMNDLLAGGEVRGWILDLRSNQGGSEPAMQRIAGLFVSEGSPLVTVTSRSGSTTALDSIGTPLDTQRPLVILTSSATASSAEMLTEALRQLGRATVVGTTTAGCVNGGYLVGLLDGSGVMVSTQRVLVGRGRVALEGIGIAPDINCSRTQDDLVAGRDPQLDEALAALNRPLPNP